MAGLQRIIVCAPGSLFLNQFHGQRPDIVLQADASRLAWYWSHIGAIDLARQMGVITEERRQELYDEMRSLKPAYASGTENGDVGR